MLVYKIKNNDIELIQGDPPEGSFELVYPDRECGPKYREINNVKWIGLLHGSVYSTGILDGTNSKGL